MTAPAFSPAPWRIHPDTDGGFSVVEIIAHNNTQVAQLESGTPDDEPITEADARLIAAAPDLYEALKHLLADFEAIDAEPFHAEEARAALAKAAAP